jgi:hypothetical protein
LQSQWHPSSTEAATKSLRAEATGKPQSRKFLR